MRTEFNIETMADMNVSIANYTTDLVHQISQPGPDNRNAVEWNKKKIRDTKSWWWDTGYKMFLDFNVHLIKQNWGSTSAGWGGMGGAAMTQTYTTVIHCPSLGIVAVYYSGQIAYVMDISDTEPENVHLIIEKPPAFSTVKNNNNIIYINSRYK